MNLSQQFHRQARYWASTGRYLRSIGRQQEAETCADYYQFCLKMAERHENRLVLWCRRFVWLAVALTVGMIVAGCVV